MDRGTDGGLGKERRFLQQCQGSCTRHRPPGGPSPRYSPRYGFDPRGDPPLLVVAGEKPHLKRRLTDWLKAQAANDLTAAVERHCETLGVRYTRLTLKDTVSRWGSCSPSGALAFSWRLIFAPPFVLDYLAAHEVAHLKEMNHSVRFWRVCQKLCPKTEEAKAWLKAYGATLHRYG